MKDVLVLSDPWSCLLGRHEPIVSNIPLNGSGTPRAAVELDSPLPIINVANEQSALPPASFPYVLAGRRFQSFHLPTDPRPHQDASDFEFELALRDVSHTLRLTNGVPRPPETKSDRTERSSLGIAVEGWIEWQVWAFQELGQLADPSGFESATRAALVRRSWDSAVRTWFTDGSQAARMALIVQLSRDRSLHRVLASISRTPRRILLRYRDNTPVSRIRELDAACIRDYARRPGITAAEKAGSRQVLQAVRRREQCDTLENRVACWTLERVRSRATTYNAENSWAANDARLGTVRRFGKNANDWRHSERLNDVSKLPQLVTQPNYPLQFDSRYQVVWKTYLRLLKEMREIDDAWTWQRALWGETGRQLLACALQSSWESEFVSTPYYRTESRLGLWTEPPSSPGPFSTKDGPCVLLDSRDLETGGGKLRRRWLEAPPFPGMDFVGASGCDQVLLWPKPMKAVLIWYLYVASAAESGHVSDGISDRCLEALTLLSSDLRRFAKVSIGLSGLIVLADLRPDVGDSGNKKTIAVEQRMDGSTIRLTTIRIPPRAAAHPEFSKSFRSAIQDSTMGALG